MALTPKRISDMAARVIVLGTEFVEAAVAGTSSEKMEARHFRGQKVTTLTSSAGVVNIDLSLGKYFTLTLTENITSITFSNAPGAGFGDSIMLRITQHASAAKTVTWPASFRWEGSAPVVSTTLSAVDLLALTTLDNGTKWDATLSKGRV